MASVLLSATCFLPSSHTLTDRELNRCSLNLRGPLCGRVAPNKGFARREVSGIRGGRFVVASVVGNSETSIIALVSFLLLTVGRKIQKRETVIPDPDYRIPVVLLGLAGGLAYNNNLLPAAPVGLLGLLLLFQTTRVRFVFDDDALEIKVGDQLQEYGENVFVGGKNRWNYSTFVNWELWWPSFPVLVYFKETQTKPEGQVHFFPIIFNGKQLYDVMVERAGPSKTSGPKQS